MIVPARPDDNTIISTGVIFINFVKAVEKEPPGSLKYAVVGKSSTIIITTIGYKNDINHVFLNNIFKINASPKNMTKNNNIETTNCIKYLSPLTIITL